MTLDLEVLVLDLERSVADPLAPDLALPRCSALASLSRRFARKPEAREERVRETVVCVSSLIGVTFGEMVRPR